jgi:methylglutaconyl-CoA hydratase
VAAEGDLEAVVQEKVADLLLGGPEALATTKALLRELQDATPEEATEIMAHRIAELRTGDEGQEGLGAFLEKREPAWRNEQTS